MLVLSTTFHALIVAFIIIISGCDLQNTVSTPDVATQTPTVTATPEITTTPEITATPEAIVTQSASLGGVDVITNGTFNTDMSDWITSVSTWFEGVSGAVQWDAGAAQLTLSRTNASPSASQARIRQTITLEPNTHYQVRLRATGALDYAILRVTEVDGDMYRTLVNVGLSSLLVLNFQTQDDTEWAIDLSISQVPVGELYTLTIDDISIEAMTPTDMYTICAIGDSQVSHLGLFPKEMNDNGMSFLMSSIQRITEYDNGLYIEPLNLGVPGNHSTDVLARITQATQAQPLPRLCYISVGTNDASGSVPTATYYSNMLAIVQALQSAGITPVLMTIPSRLDTVDVSAYNMQLQSVAANTGVALFDIQPVFDEVPNWPDIWMDDAVHYNKFAHQAIGAALGDFVYIQQH